MGGQDKGLLPWQGQPLVSHQLARLAPQVGPLMISANRHAETYAALARPWHATVVADTLPGFQGPLAGLATALQACTTPWLAALPCDTPLLPAHWVSRLAEAAASAAAHAAYAHDGRDAHYAVCLLSRALLPALQHSLAAGERRLGHWLQSAGAVAVVFEGAAPAFANLNRAADWPAD